MSSLTKIDPLIVLCENCWVGYLFERLVLKTGFSFGYASLTVELFEDL